MKDLDAALQFHAAVSAILADPKAAKAKLDQLKAEKEAAEKLRIDAAKDREWAAMHLANAEAKHKAADLAESNSKKLAAEAAKQEMALKERERDLAARETEHQHHVANHAAFASQLGVRESSVATREAALLKREAAVETAERDYKERLGALKRLAG